MTQKQAALAEEPSDVVMAEQAGPQQHQAPLMDHRSSSLGSLPDNLKEAHISSVTLIAKHGKEKITLSQLSPDVTIAHVKELIRQETRVLPKRQKRKWNYLQPAHAIVLQLSIMNDHSRHMHSQPLLPLNHIIFIDSATVLPTSAYTSVVGLVAKTGGAKGVHDSLMLSELKVKGKSNGATEITHQFILMGTPEEKVESA